MYAEDTTADSKTFAALDHSRQPGLSQGAHGLQYGFVRTWAIPEQQTFLLVKHHCVHSVHMCWVLTDTAIRLCVASAKYRCKHVTAFPSRAVAGELTLTNFEQTKHKTSVIINSVQALHPAAKRRCVALGLGSSILGLLSGIARTPSGKPSRTGVAELQLRPS